MKNARPVLSYKKRLHTLHLPAFQIGRIDMKTLCNKRLIIAAGILAAILFSLSADAGAVFAKSDRPIRILFLITNENGKWQTKVQQEIFPQGPVVSDLKDGKGKSPFKIAFVKAKDAFNEKVALAAPLEDRIALLRYPGALEAADNAGKIFNVDYIVTIALRKDYNRWIAQGVLYSINEEQREYMDVVEEEDRNDAVKNAVSSLPTVIKHYSGAINLPVTGSSAGKMYHKEDAGHVTQKGTRRHFENPRKARKAGYKPCRLCFPGTAPYKKHDPLEAALGKELTRTIEQNYVLYRNPEVVERVERIGRKIVKNNSFDDYTYRFRVLDTTDVNAYSLPGGSTYITKGLMDIIESDDELAGILSHEIAHTNRRHAVKMFRRARTHAILGTVLIIATGSRWAAVAANFANNFFVSGWSRGFEAEADRYGIIYTTAAGYDPSEYVILLKKLHDFSKLKPSGLQWFRTHPTDEQRIQEAGKSILQLQTIKKAVQRLKKIDPGAAKYVRTHPFNYLKDAEFLKEYVKIISAMRFHADVNKDYELVPLDRVKKVEKAPGGIMPPSNLDRKNGKGENEDINSKEKQ